MARPYLQTHSPEVVRWQIAKPLAVLAVTAMLAVATSSVLAQTSAPQGPQQLQLTFSSWVKLCNKAPEPNARQICVIVKDGRTDSGPLVVSVVLIEMDGEARRLIQVVHDSGAFSRPFVISPGTPRERVQILRRAFQETLKDKTLLAEAEKARLTVDPVSGEELEKLVADLFRLDAALVAKLKEVLYH